MKKFLFLLLALTMCLVLVACDNTVTAEPSGTEPAVTDQQLVADVYRQLVEYAENGQYADAWRLVMQNPDLKKFENGNEYFDYCRGMRAYEAGALGTAYEILNTVPHILNASKILYVIEEQIEPLNGHYVADNGKGSYLHLVIKDGKIASGLVGYYDEDQTFSYTEDDFKEELIVSKYTNGTEFIAMGRYYSNVTSEASVEYVFNLFDDDDSIMVLKYETYDYDTFNGLYEKVENGTPDQNPDDTTPDVQPPVIMPETEAPETEAPETEAPETEEPETECPHDWQFQGCETPLICSICGEPADYSPDHMWQDATCNSPEICSACGETRGEPTGEHTVDMENGFCSVCGEYAYDITYIAKEILINYSDYCVELKWAYCMETLEECNCGYCAGFVSTESLGEPFFSMMFCYESYYEGEYETWLSHVFVHKQYDTANNTYYMIWDNPVTDPITPIVDENGNVIRIQVGEGEVSVDELMKMEFSCENGHTWTNINTIFPQQCILCGKQKTSSDYIYLAQSVFRSVQSQYSHATPNFAFVSLYTDSNGDVCVAVHLNYEIINDYEQQVLYNLTQGKTITNPIKYYGDLADRAYGANRIKYLNLQTDFLKALISDTAITILADQIDPFGD